MYMVDVEYLTREQGKPRFAIQNFALFAEGFNHLRAKTGVFIDPYGDSRLYPDHQRLLAAFWHKSKEPEIQAFLAYMTQSIQDDYTLLFIGD